MVTRIVITVPGAKRFLAVNCLLFLWDTSSIMQ
jgi:hypothetical protein